MKEGRKKEGECKLKEIEEVEWKLEKKKREERRKNIIIKGMEEKEEKRRETVEGIIKDIEVKVDIREIIGGDRKKVREMVIVKLRNKEQKRRIMENKTKETEGKKRRIKWRLEEIASNEKRKEKRIWVGYGRIR